MSDAGTLSGHRVDRIETIELTYRYPRTIGRNARLGSHGSGGTIRAFVVGTDQGATGWGMAAGSPTDLDTVRGRPVDELIDPASGVLDDALLPLDFALHDLAAKLLDVPVHVMLGGPEQPTDTSVTCYSGAIYFDDLDPAESPRGIDAVLANCRADHDAGYRAFKLKIGRGHRWMNHDDGIRRDIEVTRAVRAAYPDARILVDANDGYTCEDLLGYLDAVADCGLFWIEEPFAENVRDLRTLRARLDAATLIADGEANPDVPFLLELAEQKLVDVLLMDVIGYGLTPWRKLTPHLRELGVRSSPHAWGQPLKTLYAANMAMSLDHILTVEGVPGSTDGIDASGYRLVDGRLHVPAAPGFGLPLIDG